MVKSQAKTVVSLLIVRRPNNQVNPNRGSKITVPFNMTLWRRREYYKPQVIHYTFKRKLISNVLYISLDKIYMHL